MRRKIIETSLDANDLFTIASNYSDGCVTRGYLGVRRNDGLAEIGQAALTSDSAQIRPQRASSSADAVTLSTAALFPKQSLARSRITRNRCSIVWRQRVKV